MIDFFKNINFYVEKNCIFATFFWVKYFYFNISINFTIKAYLLNTKYYRDNQKIIIAINSQFSMQILQTILKIIKISIEN